MNNHYCTLTHTLSLSTHMRTYEHSYVHAHLFHPTTFPPRPQVPEGTTGMQEKQSRPVCCGELTGPCQESPTSYQNNLTNDSLLTRGLNEKIYSSLTHTKAIRSHGTQSMGTCCMLWLGLVTILVCVADQSSSPTLPPPRNMQRQVLSLSRACARALSLSLPPPPLPPPLSPSLSLPPPPPPPPSLLSADPNCFTLYACIDYQRKP